MTYEYQHISKEDKNNMIDEKILYMEKNLYTLSLNKQEAEFRNDEKGLSAINQEIDICLSIISDLQAQKSL